MKVNTTHNTDRQKFDDSEVFRATIGLDFIFSNANNHKIPLCIEINGADTGLKAVETISMNEISNDERERVRIRMMHTKERIKLSAYAESLDPVAQAAEKKQAWAKARSAPGFIHAFVNPCHVQKIVENKRLQQAFIPIENRPRIFQEGNSPISQTGFWICKPITGRKGRGIQILSNKEFEQSFLRTGVQSVIAQEFIQAHGADRASQGMQDNPASMRLLIDFIYFENDTIKEIFTFAYQRVSPHMPKVAMTESELEKVYVVNFARGAKAAAVSKNEFGLAHKVALKIIRNIAESFAKVANLKS